MNLFPFAGSTRCWSGLPQRCGPAWGVYFTPVQGSPGEYKCESSHTMHIVWLYVTLTSLQEENVNGMELRVGAGNEFQGTFGQPTEDDKLNVIWVVDSNNLPFYRVGAC